MGTRQLPSGVGLGKGASCSCVVNRVGRFANEFREREVRTRIMLEEQASAKGHSRTIPTRPPSLAVAVAPAVYRTEATTQLVMASSRSGSGLARHTAGKLPKDTSASPQAPALPPQRRKSKVCSVYDALQEPAGAQCTAG